MFVEFQISELLNLLLNLLLNRLSYDRFKICSSPLIKQTHHQSTCSYKSKRSCKDGPVEDQSACSRRAAASRASHGCDLWRLLGGRVAQTGQRSVRSIVYNNCDGLLRVQAAEHSISRGGWTWGRTNVVVVKRSTRIDDSPNDDDEDDDGGVVLKDVHTHEHADDL